MGRLSRRPDADSSVRSLAIVHGRYRDARPRPRNSNRRLRIPLALLTLLSLNVLPSATASSQPGPGDTLTLAPVADTYVRSDRPTGNFGSASKLAVDASPSEHILLRFSVSGVGPNTVANARLRLYNVNRSPKGGDVYHVADDSWGEATVTWSTAPAADPTPVASFGSVVTNTWYEVDLTSLITGDGTYSLRIASTLSDGADYTSREGAAGFGPQLLVTLGAPSDTTPPSVSISSPADGQTVGGVVTVQVEASDDVAVTEVDLSVDGVLFGTDATAPYEFPWNTGASVNGAHTLQASARDAAANASTSAPVTVTVTNAPDTSPPTAPTNLSAAVVGGTRVDLQWAASSDDHGVHHYAVLRDGGEIGTSTTPSYSDTAVARERRTATRWWRSTPRGIRHPRRAPSR